jgi:release factor glutamine methyltransferase
MLLCGAGTGRERMTLKAAIEQGTKLLEQGNIAVPRLTAEVLLGHALGKDRNWLFGHAGDALTEVAWIHYGRYLYQRLAGKPTQYITRHQEFYGRDFLVTPAVLIPRPETEHVVEVALQRAAEARTAVDIGCGSGAIGVTWNLETGGECVATDISCDALLVARQNALRLESRVRFLACDLASALPAAAFDLVLSNPPYIPNPEGPGLQREVRDHEPAVALFGGPTGVEIYERLIADAQRILRRGGWLVMEIGYQSQQRILDLLAPSWRGAEVAHDLAGWPRVISARLS